MENNELQHWGIKGMRWGVRRFQNEDGSLTTEGKKRYGKDEPSSNNTPTKTKSVEDEIAERRARIGKSLTRLSDNSDADVSKRDIDVFEMDIHNVLTQTYADKVSPKNDSDVKDFGAFLKDCWEYDIFAANADFEAGMRATVGGDPYHEVLNRYYNAYVKKDTEAYAKSILEEIECREMNHSSISNDILGEDELQHWGIKGMRWGVRRFQNEDGSLTTEGKKRYGKGDSESKTETVEEKKARIIKSRSAKELYKNADLFTTQELQEAYTRLTLERNIKSLAPAEVSKGEKFMDTTINWGKKVSSLVQVGTELYSNMEKVRKLIDGEPDTPKITKYKGKDLSKVSDKELKDIKTRVQTERDIQKFIDEMTKNSYSKDKDD